VIPLPAAREVRETLLDYLRSTWQIADRDLEAALLAFLSGPQGMFKGPWVRLSLPFALAPEGAPMPLDVHPPYRPYLHQLLAWQRLSSRDGHEPEATIVTTGTGSGKTECFLFPILDHVARAVARGERGIHAIVLYPMNALASDQARRIASIIHDDPGLRGRLRVGLFVGGDGRSREMGPTSVVDDNDALRKSPPHILLTNYRMLDLLLQRPRDAKLWAQNPAGRLRYLVLDELHTYDGAQGTDVACLVRRLGARLGGADAICPVGTSATVAAEAGQPNTELLTFASRIFDQTFAEDSLLGEVRLTPDELFATAGTAIAAPLPIDPLTLDPEPQIEGPDHVRDVAARWFPADQQLAVLDDDTFRLRLGESILRHPVGRALVRAAAQRLSSWDALVAMLRTGEPALAECTAAEAEAVLRSGLTLLSWSRRLVGTRSTPLVSVQVQLWIREVRRLLRGLDETPKFRWHDDGPGPEGTAALPMVVCRECGHASWVTVRETLGDRVSLDYAEIAQAVEQRRIEVCYLHRDASLRDDDGDAAPEMAFDVVERRLLEPAKARPGALLVRVHPDVAGPKGKGRQRCPACGADEAMRFVASRSASLTSLAVGHLFTTPLNTDRKLLAFSDSVQDASHRAGFFGGRTYRFALRTALLAMVPTPGDIALSAIGPAMRASWPARLAEGRWDPDTAFVATFLPNDLEYLRESTAWADACDDHANRRRESESKGVVFTEELPAPSPALVSDVAERLRWEATRELGVAARIGRTLEQSGCLAVTVDRDRFEQAVSRVSKTLTERIGVLAGVKREAFAEMIAGLVTRTRHRGGVFDPFLERFVASGGKGFQLSKQMSPLLSPFPMHTSRPRFLTSEPKPRPKGFDSVAPSDRRNWITDWINRSLGLELTLADARDVGAAMMPLLVESKLFGVRPIGARHFAYGLEPDSLRVTREHAWRRCEACGYALAAVPGSQTDPLGQHCLRYRCDGRFEASTDEANRVVTYYQKYYAKGVLGRVWAREHTGLLGREEREDLEVEFKTRPRPHSPNLLSCTPTLEMGIDIGDLSATLLCSIPPKASSYVQRVGRAGRATGNALVLSFAATRPHDLYYFEDPLALMAGAIHPPGCYLDAPEVLRRQALAFAFDRLARDGCKMPGRVREALSDPTFPATVIAAITQRREELGAAFVELFKQQVASESRKRVEAFWVPAGDGLCPVESRLATEIARARERSDELRKQILRIDDRVRKIQSDPAVRAQLETPEQELSDLTFERRHLLSERQSFLDQDLWGFFTDHSLVPNFAFPEPGVRLDAFVRREAPPGAPAGTGTSAPEHRQWIRPPAAAIAELAPFNTFYGSGRQVVVQNIDLKQSGAASQWQLCAECHHMEEIAKQVGEGTEQCPACGAGGFREVGRRRWLAPMTHVRAFAQHRDAMVGDEREDRDRAYYEAQNFYDASASTPRAVWVNRVAGFGFELSPRLVLRRINFGKRDNQAQSSHIAGREVTDVRFVVCTECGQVQAPDGTIGWSEHWPSCAQRKLPKAKQSHQPMHLVRQLESEALRVVVPVSEHEWSTRLPNLRAALRLGLRLHFGGDPDFLMVDRYDEPLPGAEGHRRYVVILDLVPGGTGVLADLAQSRGAKLKGVLSLARDALMRCPCTQRGDEVRACHLCLYAYRERQALEREHHAGDVLDRSVAVQELDAMLAAFEGLEQADGVGTLKQEHVLESELERRLVERLSRWALTTSDARFERLDEGRWRLTIGARAWLVRAQVPIDELTTTWACRPDLLFTPEGQEPSVRPVAVFADGAAYHVQSGSPQGRIADDLKKRLGLSRSGNYLSWSLTWRDVSEHETQTISDGVPRWLTDESTFNSVKRLAAKLEMTPSVDVLDRDPVSGLLAHLRAPHSLAQLAALTAFCMLRVGGRQVVAGQAAQEHTAARTADQPARTPPDSTLGADTVLLKLCFGADDEAMLVVSTAQTALGTLLNTPERAEVTLRLDDRESLRRHPRFLSGWRQALRAWNLLQALPSALVVSREQLADLADDGASSRMAEDLVAPSLATEGGPDVSAPRDETGVSESARAVVAEIADPRAREVVLEVVRRGAPTPEVPYEVRDAGRDGRRGGEGDIEVGWKDARVGAYLDDQRDTAERLRAEGWTVFAIERGLEADALSRALGIGGGE